MSEQTAENVTWTEWGVRRTWGPCAGQVVEWGRDRSTAEGCAREWPGELVTRTVTVQPWEPRSDRCACGSLLLSTTVSERHDRGLHGSERCIGGISALHFRPDK